MLINKGLWNERLFEMFDYHNNYNMSFDEFLAAIATFTKKNKVE